MEHRLMHKPHVSSTSYISCESMFYNEEKCKFHTIKTGNDTILKIWQLCHKLILGRYTTIFVLHVAQG